VFCYRVDKEGTEFSGHAVQEEGLRLLACYNCGLESRRGIVEYFVVSGRGLCVGLIAPPEDFGGGCCVIECGQVQ